MKYKKITQVLLATFICCIATAQADKMATDSLLDEMCKTVVKNRNLHDTTNFYAAYEKHIIPFYSELNEKEQERLYDYVIFRLQRNCKEFFDLLLRLAPPPQGDWELLTEKPVSKLDKNACNDFNSRKEYYYIEADNGDTVRVTIEDKKWIEDFVDGTYSQLKFYWVSDCEFELEFISSNNKFRKNFSKPGDKYRYGLLEKGEKYFSTSVVIPGQNDYSKFKIRYQ